MSNTTRKLILVLVSLAAAVTAGLASGAPAAAPKQGTWTGYLTQEIVITDPGTGEEFASEWKKRFTVSVAKGRLVRLATTARSTCPGPEVRDHHIALYWQPSKGKGPVVQPNGAFTVRYRGVLIAGALHVGTGTGRLSISAGDCRGKGTWQLKRSR